MRLRILTRAVAASVLVAGGLSASAVSLAATNYGSDIVYTVHPLTVFATASTPPTGLPSDSQCIQQFGLGCYSPQNIRQAYDVPSADQGTGQTIVIVDAFGSPTIRQDLNTFDQTFGLPNPTLNILYPDGKPTFNGGSANEVGWAAETSLDVTWSHAIAPDATIDLVVAPSNDGNALDNAENYAVQSHLGNVMSMSFGAPEAAIAGGGNNLQVTQADQIYQRAAEQGMSVFASAGDTGATNGYATPNALFPASDPNVTSVGGTDLFVDRHGNYKSETTWNDSVSSLCPYGCDYGVFGATGGAPSDIFGVPAFQANVNGMSVRTTSDVAYNASVYTAVWVYLSFPGLPSGWYFFGGTSEGAPQWAAIAALADQAAGHPLGALNPALYAIAQNATAYAEDFHDVTIGDNALFGPGYAAGPQYDLPTGLGSPNVANLIATLSR